MFASASKNLILLKETVCRTIHGLWVSSQRGISSCCHISSVAWFHRQLKSRASSTKKSKPGTSVSGNLSIRFSISVCLFIILFYIFNLLDAYSKDEQNAIPKQVRDRLQRCLTGVTKVCIKFILLIIFEGYFFVGQQFAEYSQYPERCVL